ncbi:MAG: MATE family efflux transporter [Muribaculum sp.]|nr:MATE family efflux transporter [Muribaculum sp.]
MKPDFDYYKVIIRLGLPILVSQIGIIITAFADNIMVGRYSTEALASASFVNNLFNLANFACMGFSYGLTPILGAMFSQKRLHDIGSTLRTGLLMNLLFGLMVTLIMTIVYINLENLGQPVELLPVIRPYYLLMLGGLVPVVLFSALSQWLFAINLTRLPMWIVLASNAVNIAGNYLFIFGNFGAPELGLFGAGCSTLCARIISLAAAFVLLFYSDKFRVYRDGFISSHINRRDIININRTSWPVAAQMTCESASFSVAAVMAGWLGAISLAAYQIIVITGTLGFCIYYSIGSAIAIVVSNAAGSADKRAMRKGAFAGYHILLTLAVISSLLFFFFEHDMIRSFTKDAEVIKVTATLIFPLILYQLADATQICFANSLRGTSNVMPMLWIGFISYIIIGIPATYLLAFTFNMGIYGIILSFSVSLFPAAAMFLYFFLRTTSTNDSYRYS